MYGSLQSHIAPANYQGMLNGTAAVSLDNEAQNTHRQAT